MRIGVDEELHKMVNRYGDCDEYGLRYLVYHLARGRRVETVRELLLDFDWLVAKMYGLTTQLAIDDYALISQDTALARLKQVLTRNSQL